MANKRMFSLDVVDTDRFIEMPATSQNLYFHLGMRADDDGFVSSPKKIMKMLGCGNDDLRILIERKYAIPFESGVIVLSDWNVNNNKIKGDRYKPTRFQNELSTLTLDNAVYRLKNTMELSWNRNGSTMEPQNRLDKNRIDNTYAHQDARVSENDSKNNDLKDSNLKNEFENLWESYPNKKSKSKAMKSYIKARKRTKNPVTYEQVKKGIEAYNKYIQAKGLDMQYIKHGSTWFHQECWNDDYNSDSKPKAQGNTQSSNNGWY